MSSKHSAQIFLHPALSGCERIYDALGDETRIEGFSAAYLADYQERIFCAAHESAEEQQILADVIVQDQQELQRIYAYRKSRGVNEAEVSRKILIMIRILDELQVLLRLALTCAHKRDLTFKDDRAHLQSMLRRNTRVRKKFDTKRDTETHRPS